MHQIMTNYHSNGVRRDLGRKTCLFSNHQHLTSHPRIRKLTEQVPELPPCLPRN